MAVDDTIRAELIWQLSGVDWAVNVLHYRIEDTQPVDANNVASLAAYVGAQWTASGLRAAYPDEVRMSRLKVRDLRTPDAAPIEASISLLGTSAAVLNPAQTCVVTTLRTVLASARGRGRIFWPAPAVGANDVNGTVAPGTVALYQAYANLLRSSDFGAGADAQLAVLSRALGVSTVVTSVSTNSGFDVQVRRRDLSIV